MSTIDPGSEPVLTVEDTKPSENAIGMAALPDVAGIARPATELFWALPGHASTPGAPSLTAPSIPAAGGVLLPSSVPRGVGPGVAAPDAVSSSPEIPAWPFHVAEREQAGSLTVPPTYPSATELFS